MQKHSWEIPHIPIAGYPHEQEVVGVFSVLTGREDSDSLDFGYERFWTKSSREYCGRRNNDGPMTKDDVPVLLKVFGLSSLSNDSLLCFESVRYMSPAILISMRRAWEKESGAEQLEVRSTRMGGHIPAEMVL